jgi:hypothetical protein
MSETITVSDGIITVDETAYVSLIEKFYLSKPNYMATIKTTSDPAIAMQNFIASLIQDFDLDLAVGVQLDAIGVIVGRSRQIESSLMNVFFSWGISGVGWGQGIWLGPYTPTTGVTSLQDEPYRTLLRAKIAANSWDGTIPGALLALADLFTDESSSSVFLQDNGDMTMTVAVVGSQTPSAMTWALLIGGYVPLKPAGVPVKSYGISSVLSTPIFGFGIADGTYIGGWGIGAWMTKNLSDVKPKDYGDFTDQFSSEFFGGSDAKPKDYGDFTDQFSSEFFGGG